MLPEILHLHWGTLGFLLLLAWFWRLNGLQPLLMILCAAAVHEAGHILVLRLFGAPSGRLRLTPAGGVIQTSDLCLSYPREMIAVLAGPAANLLAGVFLNALSSIYPQAAAFAGAHWTLGIFNLLPAAPLDGWRWLQLLLCWGLGPDTGNRIAAVFGCFGAVLLSGTILFLMILSGGNLWLLPAAMGVAVSGIRTAANSA